MGREAYLMRLALGRSALEPPEGSSRSTGEQQAGAEGLSDEPPSETQHYDAHGHPFNPWSKRRARKLREAQNDILSVVGVTERKTPVEEFLGPDGSLNFQTSHHESDPDENETGELLGSAADFEYQFMSWWIHALTNRILVFPTIDRELSFRDVARMQWLSLGWRDFMFAGLPSFMFGHLVSPELWTGKVLYVLDRAMMAEVRSRKWRQMYDRMRPYIAGSIEVAFNIFILPFRLHSTLQLLGFQPESTWLGLPRLSSWLPCYGTSMLRLNAGFTSILPFFFFRPLSSLVHQYMYMSLRPAIMGPLDIGHRRLSSSTRYAASINASPLLELEPDPTILTSVFQKVFGFLRWAPPSKLHEDENTIHFRNPGLRRRETWPAAPAEAQAPEQSAANPQSELATTQRRVDHLPSSEPSTLNNAQSTTPPTTPPPPALTRMNTVATLDGNVSDPSDATIRVASIDPISGAVNLEIGLPEDTVIQADEEIVVDDGRTVNRIATTSAETGRLRRERRDRELYARPHHISRLSLEPTELLASLANGWVAGWLLLPVRGWVLRSLVKNVLRNPARYGVDGFRATTLPTMLGSSRGAVLLPWSWVNMWSLKNVVMTCMLDVVLGLVYWVAEWGIARLVGVEMYGWGRF